MIRSIRGAIKRILKGQSSGDDLQLFRQDPDTAIRQLLGIVEGKTFDRTHSGLEQREAADAAIAALCALGASHAKLLIAFLERSLGSGSASTSFALMWALAHSNTTTGLDVSAKALEHEDRFVRWAACKDLARRRPERVRSLLNRAASDRTSLVRSTAVEALITAGDETSLPVLEKRLRDRYPGIRASAAKAIAAVNTRRTNT